MTSSVCEVDFHTLSDFMKVRHVALQYIIISASKLNVTIDGHKRQITS